MGKNYSDAQLVKYGAFLHELEDNFVGAKNEVEFNLHRLIIQHQVSSCLTTMFIKLGYIERLGPNKFRILSAHAFQAMARDPKQALKLVTSYNYEKKLEREKAMDKVIDDLFPPIVETPFEEETEVPDENTDRVLKRLADQIIMEAKALADSKIAAIKVAINQTLGSNFDDSIIKVSDEFGMREVSITKMFSDSPIIYVMRRAILPGCIREVEKVFLLGIKELGKLKADGDTNKTT